MRRPFRRSGDVYAELRYPIHTSIEAAMQDAQKWGDLFPGAHVRLHIGNAIIDVRFPRRWRRRRVKESR